VTLTISVCEAQESAERRFVPQIAAQLLGAFVCASLGTPSSSSARKASEPSWSSAFPGGRAVTLTISVYEAQEFPERQCGQQAPAQLSRLSLGTPSSSSARKASEPSWSSAFPGGAP